MDIALLTDVSYQGYLDDRTSREIIVLPTSGISYNDYLNYQEYWVIGQVQRTNLSYYAPTFTLPLGASIYRIIDEDNADDPLLQSTDFSTDFNPIGDGTTFNFVHYRVYAEDYDKDNPTYNTHYTDYHVAVQDVTNNIRFEITVVIDSSISPIIFDKLFITLNIDDDPLMMFRSLLPCLCFPTFTKPIIPEPKLSLTVVCPVIIPLSSIYRRNMTLNYTFLPHMSSLTVTDSILPTRLFHGNLSSP